MSWVGIIGGVIAAGGAIYSASKSSQAAGEASETMENAQYAAIKTQQLQFKKILQLQAPFRETALQAMDDLYQYTKQPFTTSEAYKIAVAEGIKDIGKATGAQGRFRAGTTATSISNYTSKLMASELGRYDTNRLGILNALYSGSQVGGATAAASASGTNQANILMQGGQLQAGYAMQAGQAQAGLYAGLGGAYNNALSTYYLSQMANKGTTPAATSGVISNASLSVARNQSGTLV